MSTEITFSKIPVTLPAKSFRGRSSEEWAKLSQIALSIAEVKLRDLFRPLMTTSPGEKLHLILDIDIRNMEVSIDFLPVKDNLLRRAIKDAIHQYQLSNPAFPKFPEGGKTKLGNHRK